MCISKQRESSFPELEYKQNTHIDTMDHDIVNNDIYSDLLLSCDMCDAEVITIVYLLYISNLAYYKEP